MSLNFDDRMVSVDLCGLSRRPEELACVDKGRSSIYERWTDPLDITEVRAGNSVADTYLLDI
jgi:hypothetical protein